MSAKKVSRGTSILVGLLIAGIIGIVLELVELPLGTAIGTFLGGVVAAWLVQVQRTRALVTGFVVGLLSFPIQLLFFSAIMISALYIPPEVPQVSQNELLIALVATVIIQVIAGVVGGLLGGILRHPSARAVEAPRLIVPPQPPRPEKYCVQCGAGLAKETLLCPACGAKQP